MHRGPLWQFYLATALLVFVVYRAAVAVAYFLSPEVHVAIGLAYALQALIGATVTVGVWLGRRWVLGPLIALGAIAAFTTMARGLFFGSVPKVQTLGQAMLAILLTAALTLLVRHEFRPGESNEARAIRAARDPRTPSSRE